MDDRSGAPTITRVLQGERDWKRTLREGDVVKAVGGKEVAHRGDALGALARANGNVKLTIERAGNRIERSIAAD